MDWHANVAAAWTEVSRANDCGVWTKKKKCPQKTG